jgi:acetyl-CoA carboxylase carboxyltransferase component
MERTATGPEARADIAAAATVRQVARVRLAPLERLEALCDPASLEVIRSDALSGQMGSRALPGDGVVAGAGMVGGRPVFCYAQDAGFAGGSLGARHGATIVRVLELARRARAPVVGFVASAGARLQEGTEAMGGYARIFREHVRLSGLVPQVSVIAGTCAGGGSYSPALTDFLVMTRDSAMFLTGPRVVRSALGEELTADELGGARVHERNGVCHNVVVDDRAAADHVRRLLSYLPQHAGEAPPVTAPAEPEPGDPAEVVPSKSRAVYDVRRAVARVVDGGSLLEIQPRWARNVVCAFARLEGRSVGVVANQPRFLAGVLDAAASQKAARFVRTCNAFNLPLLVFVDTPGFMPGGKQEQAAVIRHGAKLVYAFAEASVPKLTVVLRKAFGGACITMNSRDLGAHLSFAWPGAQLGIMGARQAVSIIHRRQLEAGAAEDGLASAYAAEHLDASVAAASGFVDEIIAPAATRSRLAWGLATLAGTPRDRPMGNIPL